MPTGNPKILQEGYKLKRLDTLERKSLRYKRLIAETVKRMLKSGTQRLKKKTMMKYA